ncbi:MFS transporter [Noviherbaspirillum saxi]|uniref:MFS transporter n=1 Tax=Noviherbaspirillum saxi TaxID=2320863 RepID=A0A3A3G228_9BURK|nr:MFS transporter [Noviherbaspirillum saxi]RJF95486.1 MFS transporter [Noviherbaspirillum saxi]
MSTTPTTSNSVYAAIVFGAALGMFAGYPPIFNATSGIFMQPLAAEFHWGRSEVALSYSSSMLGIALISPLVGLLMDRFGARRVILVSAIIFGMCTAAMSLQTGDKAMWVGLSLLVGIFGAGTSVLGYLAILPQWFDKRLGLALAIAMCGLGAGTVVMPSLAQVLISSYGWRTAYVALGICSIVVALVAFFFLRERAPNTGSKKATRPLAPVEGMSLADGLRSWKLWTMFVAFAIASAATLSLNPHFPAMFGDKGFTPEDGAKAASLVGIGLITGRLLTGILLDRIRGSYVAAAFFLIGACGLIMIKTSTSYPILLMAAAMVGLTIGAEGDLISYLVKSYFGMRSFGTFYGIAFAGYALGGVIGPVVVGKLFDLQKSYDTVLLAFPWMLAIAGLALLSLGKYRNASIDGASDSLESATA